MLHATLIAAQVILTVGPLVVVTWCVLRECLRMVDEPNEPRDEF